MAETLHQAFVCVPLQGVRLSRSACGKRHARARREGRGEIANAPLGGKSAKVTGGDCRSCPVGAAHARARRAKSWPSGAPLELVRLRLGAPTPPRRPVDGATHIEPTTNPKREEDRVRMQTTPRPQKPKEPRAPTHVYDGEEKTLYAWAKDARNTAGITAPGLLARMRTGWSLGDALTTPPARPGRPQRHRPRVACGAGLAAGVR